MATAVCSCRSYLLQALANVVFPSECHCCGEVLMAGERHICASCLAQMARTGYSAMDNNLVERTLAGRVPFRAATAIFYYRRGEVVREVVHDIKFRDGYYTGLMMGRQMGLDIAASGRFESVDLLMPVPLHPLRRLQRGYNQSDLLCQGIAQVFRRPIERRAVVRSRYTHKQSLQDVTGREANVSHAFRVVHPERIEGRHVLIVDDVLTTGATMAAVAQAVTEVPGVSVSVATLSAVLEY